VLIYPRDPDPALFYPLDPEGIFSKSWISNLFDYEKVRLHSTFHARSGIRDRKMFGSVSEMRK
jgi:hypothetical protein